MEIFSVRALPPVSQAILHSEAANGLSIGARNPHPHPPQPFDPSIKLPDDLSQATPYRVHPHAYFGGSKASSLILTINNRLTVDQQCQIFTPNTNS